MITPSEYVYSVRCQSAREVLPTLLLMSSTARHFLNATFQRTLADKPADTGRSCRPDSPNQLAAHCTYARTFKPVTICVTTKWNTATTNNLHLCGDSLQYKLQYSAGKDQLPTLVLYDWIQLCDMHLNSAPHSNFFEHYGHHLALTMWGLVQLF